VLFAHSPSSTNLFSPVFLQFFVIVIFLSHLSFLEHTLLQRERVSESEI
jgi:hypothetical protein